MRPTAGLRSHRPPSVCRARVERVLDATGDRVDRLGVFADRVKRAVFPPAGDVGDRLAADVEPNRAEHADGHAVDQNFAALSPQFGVAEAVRVRKLMYERADLSVRVGHSNGWRMDEVLPAAEIVAMIGAEMPLGPVAPNYPGEVVERWRYRDGSGEIGVIASVTRPFCGGCTRARLSAEGKLFTCLFAVAGHDLRPLLRGGASDAQISASVGGIWRMREDRYSELRTAETAALPKVEMSYIGG
jgi:hypothetical protein